MAQKKFAKYVQKGTKEKSPMETPAVKPIVLAGLKDWGGIHHRLKWAFVSQPTVMVDSPHKHDFDEFLCFIGGDPASNEFGAEVEVSLGEEGEKQIINAPTIVCVPKGLVHCPINFKKVNKTVLFCHIYISPEYTRK